MKNIDQSMSKVESKPVEKNQNSLIAIGLVGFIGGNTKIIAQAIATSNLGPSDTYCYISLTLPVDLCLYTGFLIAWRIVYSRALHGEL